MFGIPYIRQHWIDAEVAKAALRDPFGHRLHLVFGLFCLAALPGPMVLVQVGGAGLWALAIFRAYYIHRTWRSFGCHPLFWLIALFVAWQALSITWSPDQDAGGIEVLSNRWVWVMWLTWSILQHRAALIAALILGFLIANAAQLSQILGLIPPEFADRYSGWWKPVVAGSMLTAALGLHLPVAIMGAGRARTFAIFATCMTLAFILATGSRGAWLASIALILLTLAFALFRARRDRAALRRLAFVSLILFATLAATIIIARGPISRRFNYARAEIARALEHNEYEAGIGAADSGAGARIFMLKVAVKEIATHPIRGVGAGGYRPWYLAQPEQKGSGGVHSHAHNAYMHIAATTGLVGLALFLAVIAHALRGAFVGLGSRITTYAAAPGFALIGLLLAGLTDVIHLNGQTSALFFTLLGLCIHPRPAETPLPTGPWGRPFPK